MNFVTAMAGGASVLVGKIVWDYIKKPLNGNKPVTASECDRQHSSLKLLLDERNKSVTDTIKEMKEDMKASQKEAFTKIDDIYKHLIKP